MASARLDMRLDAEVKAKAEKASALLGMKSLTEYVVRLMESDASQVIAEHESMVVENNIFDRFLNACDEAARPNQALLDAVTDTREPGIK